MGWRSNAPAYCRAIPRDQGELTMVRFVCVVTHVYRVARVDGRYRMSRHQQVVECVTKEQAIKMAEGINHMATPKPKNNSEYVETIAMACIKMHTVKGSVILSDDEIQELSDMLERSE